ncbi:hypothetical protein F4827_002894 [Paraburkholderia bannensis]|uniref:Polysaccharide pyruvyl transferase domain-containing protein n=1 Tax=Paraburkholderia bannensis TaxID=765414 RepID=A0A7W9TYI0_9BURK|nr:MULTISPECIES: polysaccharide pyruvyl transferase family protein [Paraburkholderia]MBB3258028.1 hypothetical protein [Paraburkholderia sp. WP4_3_2]MBB6103041.1 hypothetical protein [Paraburkholderia bannensis]
MNRMNILVSSTRQWNPGDEFIRKGVERLLRSILGSRHNWLLWNRNPDLFIDRWTDCRMRTDFLTNSLRDPGLDIVDLVVFAGTPEWLGQPVEQIYRRLLTAPNIPVLILGAGSGSSLPQLAPHELEVLNRDNVFITTRSSDLAECLNRQLATPKAISLPCPAFYCAPESDSGPEQSRVGVIVQNSSVVNQSIGEDFVQSLIMALRDAQGEIDLDIVSLYTDEHNRFSRLGLKHPCVYSYEPDHLLEELAGYSTIISTRLHGALAGLSAGVPSILLAEENNFRLRSTQKLFGDLLPIVTPREAFRVAAGTTLQDARQQSKVIRSFRSSAFGDLKRRVEAFLSEALPAR